MKVLIISSCSLPIPAINGGAVETLIENIVKQNEIYKKMNLSVISLYNEDAIRMSSLYKNTNFIYFKKNNLVKCMDSIITKIMRCITRDKKISSRNYIWKLVTLRKVSKNLLENDYDSVIIENTIYLFNIFKNKHIKEKYKDKYYFHIHNDLSRNHYHESVLHCKKYIVISEFIKKKVENKLGTNITKKIEVLYNGIDTNLFKKEISKNEKEEILNSLGIEKNKEIILFTGRITPEKGIKELLLAFKQLKNDNVVLLVVGSSYFGSGTLSIFENEVVKLINEMKGKVYFTGYIKYKDMWKYYKIATVAVLPSIWDEPLGLTMIEAKCSGIPIITTNSGGIPETVKKEQGIILERDKNLVDNIKNSLEYILESLDYWRDNSIESQKEGLEINSLKNYYNRFFNIINYDYK